MTGGATWNVVVLDDRREFALHVWRYLNRSLGIGTGPGGKAKPWIEKNKTLLSLDGMHRFCWLHAGKDWEKMLSSFLEEVEAGRKLLTLVDVVGEPESGYNVEQVISRLAAEKEKHPGEIEYYPVSAYHIGVRLKLDVEILSKSLETLDIIRRRIHDSSPPGKAAAAIERHILVTGAGFEIKNPLGGFGMPFTEDILWTMGRPFQKESAKKHNAITLQRPRKGFPYPVGEMWARATGIAAAASDKKLDLYWDILLMTPLAPQLPVISRAEGEEREQFTADAVLSERQKREAFRRAILKHDWGHMNQSLDAAGLGWHGWLTTNFTRFADRAVSLLSDRREWRIISTAAEANLANREDNWNLEISPKREEKPRYQYLFKLHGDVGHLHTMAVAGHDKDPFSPLSVPIDDLYQVYASAGRFLSHSLGSSSDEPEPVVWHIVGHALGDRLLLRLIRRACEQIRDEHLFLIVDPFPETPVKRLRESISGAKIEHRSLVAEEYMARLARSGLPSTADLDAVRQWFKDLPQGSREEQV